MTIRAYAAKRAGQILEPFAYEEQPLTPFEVEIAISHCGICHSDLHLIDNDWNISIYPLVPGHEIVGTITGLGEQVKHLQKGQRVGVGWQSGSCLVCHDCNSGYEPLCTQSIATCVGHYGGYAERLRTDCRFAFPIPDNMSSENAAPLLCGGATVYSPLSHFNVKPWMRVGVIGIGGLGHLALQFARAFGCEVTAFSSSANKTDEAKRFGAHHVIPSTDENALSKVKGSFDFILSTVNVGLNWATYIQLLRSNGQLCFVGVPQEQLQIPIIDLIMGQKAVCGSLIAGRAMMNEMLDFAARHHIVAQTETMPMSQANEALVKLRANQARYRIVLVN